VRSLHSKALGLIALAPMLLAEQSTAQETIRAKTPTAAKAIAASPANGDTASQGGATAAADAGMILIAKHPIQMLAQPSSSAAVLYGFPSGRRFRLVSQQSGFAQIQDVKSGATGWIDEAALGQSPQTAVSVPSEPKQALRSHKEVTASVPSVSHTHTKTIAAAPAKSKRTQKTATAKTATVDTKSAAAAPVQPKRRGLFGLRQNSAQGVLY
jgi:hypothetical protein